MSEIATENQDLLVDLNQQASEMLFSHQVQNPVVRGVGAGDLNLEHKLRLVVLAHNE